MRKEITRMKNLKKDLQAVQKQLTAISKRIEKLIVFADKAGGPKPAKVKSTQKPAVKLRKKAAAKKASKMTAPEIVMGVLASNKQGLDIGTIKEKTGFIGQKLYSTLSKMKKQGKIKNPKKGFYVKA